MTAAPARSPARAELDAIADLLADPDDRGPLLLDGGPWRGRLDGAAPPELLPRAGVSNADVSAFYEVQPFPDYEDLDSPRALCLRARRSGFAAALDRFLPLDAVTLEAGCGTGQLANFLALSQRRVVGLDFCRHSLRLAVEFRDRFRVHGARFVRGDVFHPPFRDEAFDVVIASGVLHHTGDPEAAMRSLLRLLRHGGHFVLGLYNRYARLPTKLRGLLIRALGARLATRLRIDPITRRRGSDRRRRSWLRDQYFHPLESTHSVDEVLRWFAAAGLDYVNAVPKIVFGERFTAEDDPFEQGLPGTRLDHLAMQLGWAFTQGHEGGLFVVVGRKR